MQRITDHIEHPIGILAAGLSSLALGELFTLGVNGIISVCIGAFMVIVTHFLKRRLNKKFPLDNNKNP